LIADAAAAGHMAQALAQQQQQAASSEEQQVRGVELSTMLPSGTRAWMEQL
jgi:hypothetical protein